MLLHALVDLLTHLKSKSNNSYVIWFSKGKCCALETMAKQEHAYITNNDVNSYFSKPKRNTLFPNDLLKNLMLIRIFS